MTYRYYERGPDPEPIEKTPACFNGFWLRPPMIIG